MTADYEDLLRLESIVGEFPFAHTSELRKLFFKSDREMAKSGAGKRFSRLLRLLRQAERAQYGRHATALMSKAKRLPQFIDHRGPDGRVDRDFLESLRANAE